MGKSTGGRGGGVTMAHGPPVRGTVKLKGRPLMVALSSAERAKRGTALMTDARAGWVGSPLTTIETVEQAMAARAEGLTMSEPAPAIAPEVATPLIHAMLDRQYRATLDEPIGILGDITPRAAVQTAAGRHRVAGWLKHLENRSSSQLDANDPMATYDFTWMWRELGIENLRK